MKKVTYEEAIVGYFIRSGKLEKKVKELQTFKKKEEKKKEKNVPEENIT